MPGGILSISANGNLKQTGVLWATLPVLDWPRHGPFPGRLYAFDAEDLHWLWDTGWNGAVAHWVPPTVAGGQVFLATFEGLVVYGLCSEEKPCPAKGQVYQPQSVFNWRPEQLTPDMAKFINGCKSCHNQDSILEHGGDSERMNEMFPNGGAMRAFSAHSMVELAPPLGHPRVAVFEGHGVQTYQAKEDVNGERRWTWQLTSSDAELVEVNSGSPGNQHSTTIKVRLTQVADLSATDGSSATAETLKTALAPVRTDAPWILFRISQSGGNGILSGVSYIERVHTHAG